MTDRAKYILDFYWHLTTTEERQALWLARALLKRANIEVLRRFDPDFTVELEARLRETWLRDGPEKCFDDIAARVDRDHGGEMYFHTCPKCGGLCRTPKPGNASDAITTGIR